MAGGSMGPAGVSKERAHEYKGRVTAYVVVACLVAAIGGSLFGYDIGISGSLPRFSAYPVGEDTVVFRKKFNCNSWIIVI